MVYSHYRNWVIFSHFYWEDVGKYTRLIWTWELISCKCSETEFLLYLEWGKKDKYPDKNISAIKEMDLKTQARLVHSDHIPETSK